ncbi:hypothetical protein tb265_46970 [Gemmatimonadetes bacterium T265]|nr:hypothetical protein tb265_46970 [Gemmatimonadetes bacterium T265]
MLVRRSAYAGGATVLLALCSHRASAQARAGALPPPPMQEHVPPDEPRATAAIERLLVQQVTAQYQATGRPASRPAERDAHPKGHGCVKARFTVDAHVPAALRVGVFARPKSYVTWIRYSNAVGTDDHAGLSRGMAIKLTGVPGRKLLANESHETTHDFLLVTYPAFNIRSAADYADLLTKSARGQLPAFFAAHPDAERMTHAAAAVPATNPLLQRFFSMTPYTLGARYVKYSAEPITCSDHRVLHDSSANPATRDPDYLRAAMEKTLANGDACFRFMVQSQTDTAAMPVEDATVVWDEARSPFVPVATITIPRQQFAGAEQMRFCENLSYTPWHALPEHRPAGTINRVRRSVYEAISTLRHRLNGAARAEPTGRETFPGGD